MIGVLGGEGDAPLAAILRAAGLPVADAEPPPKQITPALAARYGFLASSVRCGALGDIRQVRQLLEEAHGLRSPRHAVWTGAGGGLVDRLRADVEPACATEAELLANRRAHLAAVRRLTAGLDQLVLPLFPAPRLADADDGTVFPPDPAGSRPPPGCRTVPAQTTPEEQEADLAALLALLRADRPGLVLRLVVPLRPGAPLAEMTEAALLRALAADWATRHEGVLHDPVVDDLATRLGLPGADPRLGPLLARAVAATDRPAVLALAGDAPPPAEEKRRAKREKARRRKADPADAVCEDELLDAFS